MVEILAPQPVTPFRTLRDTLAASAAALEARITTFEAAVTSSLGWELDSVNTSSADDVHVVGRICSASTDRAQALPNVLQLEGSRATSQGARVALDVSLLSSYSLFPGQVIGVAGRNPTGGCISAHKIVDALPRGPRQHAADASDRRDVRMVIAAGPFVRPDRLTWEPLQAVLQYCRQHTPGCLLLSGPFLPDAHPALPLAEQTCHELFEQEVRSIH